MAEPCRPAPGPAVRRLVLGAAFAVGLGVAVVPRPEVAHAGEPALVVVQAERTTPAAPSSGNAPQSSAASAGASAGAAAATPGPAAAGTPASPSDADADEADSEPDASTTRKGRVIVDNHGIVVQKGSKRVRVEGLGVDREYDSFEQFVQDAPWLAGLVFLTVLLVFLVPLLIVVLLIWYKIRKNRMANETMLKLAERGVVSTTAAMDAVATGTASTAAEAATTTAPGVPAYEHARALQRRAAWSDLRKSVILTGIGLGLTLFSMLDDGTPNSVGLVLLFVGVGYGLLWHFEGRGRTPNRDAAAPPSGSV